MASPPARTNNRVAADKEAAARRLEESADDQSIGPQRPQDEEGEQQSTCIAFYIECPAATPSAPTPWRTAETRRLHRGADHDSKETELGSSKNSAGAVDEWN
jgi:hypothetical protein